MKQASFFNAGPDALSHADMAHWPLHASWTSVRAAFLASAAGQSLTQFLTDRLAAGAIIYPPQPFQALQLTALVDVRIVILGQDPYHGPGQAHGLAFSVSPGQCPPPSLRNIFKEIARDSPGQTPSPPQRNLVDWARQGVLLLNTCLTVEDARPASHARLGWETFSDALIHAVSAQAQPTVFMLWGSHAQAKECLIDASRHLVLTANHPSPLSARRPPKPFIGCGHFRQANAWLIDKGYTAVNW